MRQDQRDGLDESVGILPSLAKTPTGISGLDEVTGGGFPRGRPNLQRLCEERLPGRYEIELVDLVANPRLAAGDEILAVPTLVRRHPQPMRKIIGDLSDAERVLVGLQLLPKSR